MQVRGILFGIVALLAGPLAAQPAMPQITIAPATATPVVDPGAEMICRKGKETGSLVKSKKTCHTRSQWAYIDDQHQRFGRQMVQDGTTRQSGN